MVIMWDVDGVLANFTEGYHSLANEMFGVEVPLNAPPSWDWLEDTIGSENVGKIWNRIKQEKDFWYNLNPLATYEELTRIRGLSLRHDNYFATSRVGATAKQQTERWLETYVGINLKTPTVLMSTRKADAANALAASYTIDDKAGNVLAVYYNSPKDRHVYVLDTPYNHFDTKLVGSRVRRVSSVSAFLDDVEAGR